MCHAEISVVTSRHHEICLVTVMRYGVRVTQGSLARVFKIAYFTLRMKLLVVCLEYLHFWFLALRITESAYNAHDNKEYIVKCPWYLFSA